MNTPIGLILVVVGILLLVFGLGSAESIQDSFSRLFTGHPTDHTMWLIVGGCVCLVAGLFGCYRGTRGAR